MISSEQPNDRANSVCCSIGQLAGYVHVNILCVVGTRPNFIKIAPLLRSLRRYPEIGVMLVHTGQHYDAAMSQVFFRDLDIPEPDINLGVGSGSHAQQTAEAIIGLERVMKSERPSVAVVVGDVNSTLAAALVAAKMGVAVAHVEAGLRSFDRSMPEEINRVVTDTLADYLFTPSRAAGDNLLHEGIPAGKSHFAGNIMIDALMRHLDRARGLDVLPRFNVQTRGYALLTLHRPSNTDDPNALSRILAALAAVQDLIPILFPAHPRTTKRLREFGLWDRVQALPRLLLTDPLPYLEFLHLMSNACFVMTDSGGIQEETTFLGVPCLTLRTNTERPITVTVGTNEVVGTDPERIIRESRRIIAGQTKRGAVPELWDGKAASRIVDILVGSLNGRPLHTNVREQA